MDIDLLKYLDFREFLRDYYAEQKRLKPCFSHRYFCKRAGFKTSNVLKLAMEYKRNLSRSGAIKFTRALELTKRECRYFETLVLYNQTEDPKEKSECLSLLLEMKRKEDVRLVGPEHYSVYAEWYTMVVREMVELPGYDGTDEWIAKRICPSVSVKNVRQSMDALRKAGILKKDVKGKWKAADVAITTPVEVDSREVAHFNREMVRLAIESSFRFAKTRREISGLTLRTSQETFELIKRRIVEFKKEVLEMAMDDKNADKVYQFNVQLFPLLREESGS
jgi:uncharacterized protein (TIGR02147 family)